MTTQTIEIVDRGSGPQLSTSGIAVLPVFLYLRRGHGYDFIRKAFPSLSRDEFNVIVDYINRHGAPGYTLIKRLSSVGDTEVWEAKGPSGKSWAIKIMPMEALAELERFPKLELCKQRIHAYWEFEGRLIVLTDLPEPDNHFTRSPSPPPE